MKRSRLALLAALDVILAVLIGGGGFVLFFTGLANVLSPATRGNIINFVLIIVGGAMMSFVGIGRGSPRATFFGARAVDPANMPGFGRSRLFSGRGFQTRERSPMD